MRVSLSPEAVSQLEAQVRYLRDCNAPATAERLHIRVMEFLSTHLARFPNTGRKLGGRDLWEIWIPGTRLVLWYRIAEDHVVIATVWHTSQDRQGTP